MSPIFWKKKTCQLLIPCLVLCGIGSVILADDLIPIATVLADPRGYHLKEVMFQGTARDVTPLPPSRLKSALCWGGYTFRLEDKTGSIEVFFRGICGGSLNLQRVPDQILEGDQIILEAIIIAGYYNEENVYQSNGVVTALSEKIQRCPPC